MRKLLVLSLWLTFRPSVYYALPLTSGHSNSPSPPSFVPFAQQRRPAEGAAAVTPGFVPFDLRAPPVGAAGLMPVDRWPTATMMPGQAEMMIQQAQQQDTANNQRMSWQNPNPDQQPLLAAIKRVQDNKQTVQRLRQGGLSQQDAVRQALCINRRNSGQYDGSVSQQNSGDLNIQGWSKNGPFGFAGGAGIDQQTNFGANWAGLYSATDC